MDAQARESYLKLSLRVFGAFYIIGIYLMMRLFTGMWGWEPHQPEFEQMIQGIYVVIGIFMLIAAQEPSKHRLFISFVAWSSAAHGAIMAVQAIVDSNEHLNFFGDIPALFLVAIALWLFMPKKS